MITTAFLSIFFWIVSWFVNLLPNVTANSSFGSAITTASYYISGIYHFLPLITATLLVIISFDVLFESSYLFYKAIMWVIKRLPTQS